MVIDDTSGEEGSARCGILTSCSPSPIAKPPSDPSTLHYNYQIQGHQKTSKGGTTLLNLPALFRNLYIFN